MLSVALATSQECVLMRCPLTISRQVAAHHGDLLQQATGIQHLEDVLKMITNRVASLSASLERIQEKIQKPYAKIVARTTQLSRLQEACELLRRTLRYASLVHPSPVWPMY